MILVVSELGRVDSDLRCSLGWWADTVATYCPSRIVEHLTSKSTQPNSENTRITLYITKIKKPILSFTMQLMVLKVMIAKQINNYPVI